MRISAAIMEPETLLSFGGSHRSTLNSCSVLGRRIGEGNGTLFQYSCLENPMDGGAW